MRFVALVVACCMQNLGCYVFFFFFFREVEGSLGGEPGRKFFLRGWSWVDIGWVLCWEAGDKNYNLGKINGRGRGVAEKF